MTSAAQSSGKLRTLIRQLIAYFGVAGVGLVVDFGVLFLLTTGFGMYYLVGATAGFLCGLTVTYVLSERFVFTNPRIRSATARFLLFAAIGLMGLLLLDGIMWVLTDRFGWFYLWSKVAATGIVYLWNFFARRSMYSN